MNGRTWGPFTGRHLTTMVVAAMAMIASGTVWAVASYNNVAVMDPATGVRAQVDSSRRMQTYDLVQGFDELPANFVRFGVQNLGDAGDCLKLATPPAGKGLIVKSLVVDAIDSSSVGYNYDVYFYVGAYCGESEIFYDVNPSNTGVTSVNLEPGIVVPAGKFLWVGRGSTGLVTEVFGTGYLVPAAYAPNSVNVTPAAVSRKSPQAHQGV